MVDTHTGDVSTRLLMVGFLLFVFFVAGSGVSVAGSAPSGCTADGVTAKNIPYVTRPGTPGRSTSLDIYAPTRAKGKCEAPLVVWVHGGGWRTGDKSNNVRDKIPLFNDTGYMFVSVNYRLTDIASPDPVVYPEHNHDVAAALAWLVEHADDYGGDARRVALLGHSAGAAIVAAVATDEGYLRAEGLDLDALTCAAPLDTQAFDIAARIGAGGPEAVLYSSVFTDPARWAEASPMTHVAAGKDIPPMLLVERGEPERRAVLADFVTALETADVPTTVVDGGGLTHGEVNSQIGAPGDTVMTPPVMSFLADCFTA